MKMDHHCPWINNCVGHFNHGHFVAFLTFAVLGCAQASFVLAMTLYYGLNRVSCLFLSTVGPRTERPQEQNWLSTYLHL